VPYARYGESLASVTAAILGLSPDITRQALQTALPAGAARNALDCALWDLEAKAADKRVWQLAGLAKPHPVQIAYTLSLDTPDAMRAHAAQNAHRPLLKLKLGTPDDMPRLEAVRQGAPNARLIVDANEGWTADSLAAMLAACADTGVELVEQPLPAGNDEALRAVSRAVTVCADESAHGLDSLDQLVGKYDAINIKLDKTGGLTPAIALAHAARERDLRIMVGCMLATSLAMAPAFLLAPFAEVIDLDGPLLLKEDRSPAIRFDGSLMHPAPTDLWG
jgi:L-alanine-DL-glutamate epimerase-like enolase superfamily enzyme